MGESAVSGKHFFDVIKLLTVRKIAEQKQIDYFFKAKSVVMDKALYDIFNVNASVIEFAVTGNGFSVDNFVGAGRSASGESRSLRYASRWRHDPIYATAPSISSVGAVYGRRLTPHRSLTSRRGRDRHPGVPRGCYP